MNKVVSVAAVEMEVNNCIITLLIFYNLLIMERKLHKFDMKMNTKKTEVMMVGNTAAKADFNWRI